jgi:hypothetical protein
MSAAAAIPSVRARQRVVLGAHKVFAACTAMAASAENPDLIDKVAFFHFFYSGCKDNL